MIEELADRIWGHEKFRAEYDLLVRHNLACLLNVEPAKNNGIDGAMVGRLLQSATSFSISPKVEHREAAYRIATAAYQQYAQEFPSLREIACLVFGRLGNFPAVSLLWKDPTLRDLELSRNSSFEVGAREWANSVALTASVRTTLTDFQKRLWQTLEEKRSLAVTAPTSAGKSFALQRYLASHLARSAGWALYLVPTRALINQVSASLSELFRSLTSQTLTVSTIPLPPSELGAQGGAYVLTQERLQLLLETDQVMSFNLVIVDEAQMVAEGARGVVLQSVLEKLYARNSKTQLLFGSPQTKNPELFAELFELPDVVVVRETESPVAQNLVFIDTNALKVNEVAVTVQVGAQKENLGVAILESGLFDADQTLASLSWFFGKGHKNLIYAGGQAKSEEIADKVVQLVSHHKQNGDPDPLLVELSRLLKEVVHPDFSLAQTVLHKVGFHYGNMPTIVRRTIEDFFVEGRLDYLVCTSTLLHGVNLPARNLFMLDPTKGWDWEEAAEIPISPIEFWNLAGRAGRLGKEFEGNVFLIDQKRWRTDPFGGDRLQHLEPATTKTLQQNTEKFVEFVANKDHASGQYQTEENIFVKLYSALRKGTLEHSLSRIFNEPEDPRKARVMKSIEEASQSIDVPVPITDRNIYVSVFRQQEMLDYLVGRIKQDGPEPFVPIHPLRPWDETFPNYTRLFKRIHSHFERIQPKDKSQYYFAPLALRWMRGEPVSRLIDNAFTYKKSKSKSNRLKVATVIRATLADIEADLRFRYVKYTSCYNDLLAEALRRTQNTSLVDRIPPIALFLEIGASSRTMVNLIGLGLSRTAAGMITEIAVKKDMDRGEAGQFLQSRNWNNLLSPIVVREISRITGSAGN